MPAYKRVKQGLLFLSLKFSKASARVSEAPRHPLHAWARAGCLWRPGSDLGGDPRGVIRLVHVPAQDNPLSTRLRGERTRAALHPPPATRPGAAAHLP